MQRSTLNSHKPKLQALAVLSAVTSCLLSCALAAAPEPPQTGITKSEIVIGSCLPLTGRLAWKGAIIQKTAEAYFESVNEHGGIHGRKLRLAVCDDGYDPEKAVRCFNTCLKDKVFVGSFFNGSATCAKYTRMGELNSLPLMGFLVGASVIYDQRPYQFVLRPSYAEETDRIIKDLYEKHGVRKFGLIYQSDVMGASIRESVIKTLNRYHTAPVAEASFSRDLNDPQTGLETVEKSSPEVLILGVNSGGIAPAIAWRHSKNCKALCISFSVADDALLKQGKASDGVVITQVMPPIDSAAPAVQKYKQLVSQKLRDEKPNVLGLEVYLNAQLLVEALKRAGQDLNRDKFAEAMESLHDYDIGAGAKFKVTFNSTRHVGLSPEAIYFSEIQNAKLTPASDQEIEHLVQQAKKASTP